MDAPFPAPTPDRPAAPAFIDGLSEVADRYDLILCDVWGVLHDGIAGFPEAGEALRRFRDGGGRVVLVSNAPRPGFLVTRMLDGLHVDRAAYDDIRTSGDLTRRIVEENGARPVHFIGPERDIRLFEGLPARFSPLEEAEYVVCTGLLDDERETVADYADRLGRMRERGLLMVCANPDIVVERGSALILCAGALAAAYSDLGGEVVMPGKPHAPIYADALRAGEALLGRKVDRRRVLAVGDAIRTDVAGGNEAGLDTLLVARGIHAGEIGLAERVLNRPAALTWLEAQLFRPTLVTAELAWG